METTSSVITSAPCPVPEPMLTPSCQVHPASSIHTRAERITQSHLVSVPSCDREKCPERPPTSQSFPQPCLRRQVCSTESSGELCSEQQYSSSPSSSPSAQATENFERDGCQGRGGTQTNSRGEGKQGKNKTVPFPKKKKSDRYASYFYMIMISYHIISHNML